MASAISQSVPMVGGNVAVDGQTPNGWRVRNSGIGSVRAYVVCAN
jgi:hypothetical protein